MSKCDILKIDTSNEYIKKSKGMVNLFLFYKFNVRMPIIKKKLKTLMILVPCQKQLEFHQHI